MIFVESTEKHIKLMLETIHDTTSQIHFKDQYKVLDNLLKANNYSKIFILVDENTHRLCLPIFLKNLVTTSPIEIIEINAGEENKQIATCKEVWGIMSDFEGDRKSLLINVGGGVVTDLGGFVGATFMRGIDFINIPTTLLAMVDASVGGKTGVDLGNLKNQIGVITNPLMVLIDPIYLQTLPAEELRSGLAEMLKHGLIHDEAYWNRLSNLKTLTIDDLDELIHYSVKIKHDVVTNDPYEKGLRKILNFGHTIGHAIESYFLQETNKKTLLHGEAIAIGMIMEAFLATKLTNFPKAKLEHIKTTFLNYFEKVPIEIHEMETIIGFMRFDKKNSHGNVNFVLLEDIGKPVIDITSNKELILESLSYYLH